MGREKNKTLRSLNKTFERVEKKGGKKNDFEENNFKPYFSIENVYEAKSNRLSKIRFWSTPRQDQLGRVFLRFLTLPDPPATLHPLPSFSTGAKKELKRRKGWRGIEGGRDGMGEGDEF